MYNNNDNKYMNYESVKYWFGSEEREEEPGSGSKEGVFANGGEGARDIGGDDAAL